MCESLVRAAAAARRPFRSSAPGLLFFLPGLLRNLFVQRQVGRRLLRAAVHLREFLQTLCVVAFTLPNWLRRRFGASSVISSCRQISASELLKALQDHLGRVADRCEKDMRLDQLLVLRHSVGPIPVDLASDVVNCVEGQ